MQQPSRECVEAVGRAANQPWRGRRRRSVVRGLSLQSRSLLRLGFAAALAIGPLASSASAQAPSAPSAASAAAATAYANAVQNNLSEFPVIPAAWLAASLALVLAWVGFGDWVNRDSQIFSLGYKKWNPIVFFPFAVLMIALSFLPLPAVARIPIAALGFVVPMIVYIVVHNKNVQPHQTVLTGSWFRYVIAGALSKVGVKISTERLAEYEKGAKVDLLAIGAADANTDNANLLRARQSPGYLLVKDLVAEMVDRRIDKVRLDYGQQGVAVRQEIDGAWHPAEARDRESADVMLAVMKTLANLDVKERRAKQSGQFGAKFEGKSLLLPVTCQGTKSGEAVMISKLDAKAKPHTYESLGLREGLAEQWAAIMASDQGLAVFSTMPGDGLTTLIDASLEETDRLMRDFFAIEDEHHRERELQNIAVHTYDSKKGEAPATLMPKLVRLYPNVYIVRDFVDVASATALLKEIPDEKLVITSVKARDAADALLRLLATKLPAKQFAANLSGVLYQRLVRKLCEKCKVGYQPSAEMLKKLGIPAGKVQKFFRPPKGEEIEKPCQHCRGLGYYGRTGIFELLMANDQIREILVKQPKAELIKKAARAAGQRSLQEEGILLVAKGVTSLPELQRVLKGE